MSTNDELRIVNVIICEDIRHEMNNKLTLVGVYSNDILVAEFPATNVRVAVYCEVNVRPIELYPFSIIFKYSGIERIKIEGQISIDKLHTGVIASPQVNMTMEREGYLEIVISVGGASIVVRRHVSLGPVNLFGAVPAL